MDFNRNSKRKEIFLVEKRKCRRKYLSSKKRNKKQNKPHHRDIKRETQRKKQCFGVHQNVK
jgi:hypothetical protein